MAPLHQMLVIVCSGIFGFLMVVGIVAMLKPSPHDAASSLPAEVIEHSKTYVARLGARPFDELKTNQKLLLLHAYYNLGNYQGVVQRAEIMIDDLRQLPRERKIAFADMVENAYRHLGQEKVVAAFRRALGL